MKKDTKKSKTVSKAKPKKKATIAITKPKVSVGEKVDWPGSPLTSGKSFSIEEAKGKIVVLYFYPKDNTPGCTLEGQDFTKLHSKFKKAGVEVLGVSRDSLKSHESFKEKMCFPFELLSDEEGKLCQHFGVIKEKNMYGKKVIGIERSTFVIDRGGVLSHEWRGVKVPGHAQEVLNYVQSL